MNCPSSTILNTALLPEEKRPTDFVSTDFVSADMNYGEPELTRQCLTSLVVSNWTLDSEIAQRRPPWVQARRE